VLKKKSKRWMQYLVVQKKYSIYLFDFFFNTSGYGFFGDTTRELIARPRTIGLVAKYNF